MKVELYLAHDDSSFARELGWAQHQFHIDQGTIEDRGEACHNLMTLTEDATKGLAVLGSQEFIKKSACEYFPQKSDAIRETPTDDDRETAY